MPAKPSCVPYNQPRSFLLLARAAQADNERVPPLPAHHSPMETFAPQDIISETAIVDIGPNINDGGVDSVDIAIDPETTEEITPQYRLPHNDLQERAFVTSDEQKMLYIFILLALLCANLQQIKMAIGIDCCNVGNVVRGGLNLMSLVILVILISFRFASDVIQERYHRERWYTYLVVTVLLLNIFNLAFS